MGPRAAGLVLALLLAAAPAAAGFFEGRVVKVLDGDTIEVLVGQQTRRVRLFGIDTPERGQPWYAKSKRALSKRVFGKEVRVNDVDTDRYGRTVGEVYADNVCVGCELVREGNAWVYRKYTDDPVLYQLEAEARAARRGIWGLPESQRVPPWEWRHPGEQDPAQAGAGAPPAPSNFAPDGARAASTCGSKSFCREMASCDEARFYLYQCGVMRLDGDGDGIPCEALCR